MAEAAGERVCAPEADTSRGLDEPERELAPETVPRVGVAADDVLVTTVGEELAQPLCDKAGTLGDAPLVREGALVKLVETHALTLAAMVEDGVVAGDALADTQAVAQDEGGTEPLEHREALEDGQAVAEAKSEREGGEDGEVVAQRDATGVTLPEPEDRGLTLVQTVADTAEESDPELLGDGEAVANALPKSLLDTVGEIVNAVVALDANEGDAAVDMVLASLTDAPLLKVDAADALTLEYAEADVLCDGELHALGRELEDVSRDEVAAADAVAEADAQGKGLAEGESDCVAHMEADAEVDGEGDASLETLRRALADTQGENDEAAEWEGEKEGRRKRRRGKR